MHWDALPEPPHHSQHNTHPIQPSESHANLDMYTQSGGHPRTQSTNTHADMNAARYTLLHSSSADTSLFREHPVLHFLPLCLSFPSCLPRSTPQTKPTIWAKHQNLRRLNRVSPALTPSSDACKTPFFSPPLPHVVRSLPPLLAVAWQASGADMFRMHSGNGLIKNAKQLAITVRGPNGH